MEEESQLKPANHPFTGLSYFYGGTLAVIISWVMATVLSGCRFGNYTSPSQPPDPVTGFYDANPASLQFCATTGATHCVTVSTTKIPSFIAAEITNPVALILEDAATGDAVLTDALGKGQSALPIWVGSDFVTLYYVNSTAPATLWRDLHCTTQVYLTEDGTVVPGPGHPINGSSSYTVGSLTLKVQVIQTFDGPSGSCAAELQSMSNCYQDVTQCGGADAGTNQQYQVRVQQLFGPYLQAGAMAASDIPHVANVAYEVHYQ